MPSGTDVSRAQELQRRADDTETLAKLVSYGADKIRLQERARRLRQQAQELLEAAKGPDRASRGWFGR